MLATIKGYYDNGKIFLEETPPVSSKTSVMITFLTDRQVNSSEKRMPGGLKGKVRIPDDFNDPMEDLKDYF